MSDSEYEVYNSNKTFKEGGGSRKGANRKRVTNSKRKSEENTHSSPSNTRKKNTFEDVFGLGSVDRSETVWGSSNLSSHFVNRIANGSERRVTSTTGDLYIDLKVYKSEDARVVENQDLWKKALVRVKFQTDEDSIQWRKLQSFVREANTLFSEAEAKFYKG